MMDAVLQDSRLPELADHLLLIERELRLLQWWSAQPPEDWRLASTAPFCFDTLQLEEWLQWIFLPRMKMLIEQNARLPGACGIRPVAELSWRQRSQTTTPLLELLAGIDQLLSG